MCDCLTEDLLHAPKANGFTLSTVYLYFKYCNLRCRHCWINPPHSSTQGLKSDELDMSSIISALDECRELGLRSIKITGGEPFVRRDIFELLEYLKRNNVGINIETNAVLIRQKEAGALKAASVRQVAVSLDGPDAAVHESLRGVKGSFDDALKGVRALIDEKLNVQIITCLWKGNADRVKDTIAFAASLGASSVKINPIHAISRAGAMENSGETLSVKETIEFYHSLTAAVGKAGKDEKRAQVIFDIPPAFRTMKEACRARICSCGIFNILGLLGDGRVSICGIGSVAEALVLGRIGEDRISDIWHNNSVLKEMRQDVPLRLEGVCGRCIFKSYCLGKCRANAYYLGGSIRAPLSFCQAAYDEGLFPESRLI
jgi:SynChlorMet cassette radical SAM/SPASM protein ScmF